MQRTLAVGLLALAAALSGCVLPANDGADACAADCGASRPLDAAPAAAGTDPAASLTESASPSESTTSTAAPAEEPASSPAVEPSPAEQASSTTTSTGPPRADEVEVRDVRVEAGPSWASISWTVWPSAPKEPIRVEDTDHPFLGGCFCPTNPQLVDGRYVSELGTMAGATQFWFRLESYTWTKDEHGTVHTSPVVLYEGSFMTTHAPLAIIDVSATLQGNCLWFNAHASGDGQLHPTFRWNDADGAHSITSSVTETQGKFDMAACGDFTNAPDTATMDLRNDRGEQVVSGPFPVQRA